METFRSIYNPSDASSYVCNFLFTWFICVVSGAFSFPGAGFNQLRIADPVQQELQPSLHTLLHEERSYAGGCSAEPVWRGTVQGLSRIVWIIWQLYFYISRVRVINFNKSYCNQVHQASLILVLLRLLERGARSRTTIPWTRSTWLPRQSSQSQPSWEMSGWSRRTSPSAMPASPPASDRKWALTAETRVGSSGSISLRRSVRVMSGNTVLVFLSCLGQYSSILTNWHFSFEFLKTFF